MPKFNEVKGKYFYGNEISEYGQKNGYVDYGTLAKAFDAVLANTLMEQDYEWECENGSEITYNDENGDTYTAEEMSEELDNLNDEREELENRLEELDETDEEYYTIQDRINEIDNRIEYLENNDDYDYDEVYQWFIISGTGAEILKDWTDELVMYNSYLDLYVWGVKHWGTSWDYVLTDIKCEKKESEE